LVIDIGEHYISGIGVLLADAKHTRPGGFVAVTARVALHVSMLFFEACEWGR
jgi:hypothetical protein